MRRSGGGGVRQHPTADTICRIGLGELGIPLAVRPRVKKARHPVTIFGFGLRFPGFYPLGPINQVIDQPDLENLYQALETKQLPIEVASVSCLKARQDQLTAA